MAITATALCCTQFNAAAIIDPSLQMQLGNPSGAIADTNNHSHYLIVRAVEAMDYNDSLGQVNWASWDLTSSDVGSAGRSPYFFTDTNLPPNFFPLPGDAPPNGTNPFSGSGYDRGHMCPSADRTDNRPDNDAVFYMSNIIPQASLQNENIWADFEGYCRGLLSTSELLIICGPSLFTTNKLYSNHVTIPGYTWKIAVVVPLGAGTATNRITANTRVIAINIPNVDAVGSDPWQNYITSVNEIQNDTGFTFFTALAPNLAAVLRSKVDGQAAPAPGISGFSPSSGSVGVSVSISGTNLNFTTNVAFNGLSAAFSINSSSNVTAIVPANATSGLITVKTLGGTVSSSGTFTVIAGTNYDLSITAAHSGSFTQGDIGDTLSILVTNVGTITTTGSVAVSNALPAGLVATGLSGAGWTTDLSSLTCTRSDSLGPNAAYPAISITVNVLSNAPAVVTNVASLTNANETNLLNNTSLDVISISPSTAPTNAIILAGWDTSSLPGGTGNYGPSPFAATTNAPNVTVIGLTRGAGVGTSSMGAQRGWGGNGWTNQTSAAAIGSNQFFTFAVGANAGYQVSLSAISRFDYRHSGTGPTNGLLQYQLGTGSFTDITLLSYPSNTTAGGSLDPINLSNISALQNVGPGTNVTFRVVNWGGGSAGTWYVFDVVASNTAPDLVVQGTVSPVLAPIEAWRLQYFGTTANSGAAADTAVNSSDGMPNLLKYALGLNPLVAAANPVVGDITTGHLRLTLPKNPNATDITYIVQVTGDLVSGPWTTAGTVVDQNTSTLLQVHDGVAVPAATQRFIRLEVTHP